jgi:hypothetical protein
MKVSDAFPSKYLKVEDLNDVDLVLTITKVTSEILGQGAEAQKKLIVHFEECEKGLACNKTNAGVIAKLYGDDTDDWIGHAITLWPNHDVEFKGEIVSAIRVRSKAPAGGNGAAQRRAKPTTSNNRQHIMTLEEAVALCATVNIDRAALIAHLKNLGRKGWNGQRDQRDVEDLVSGFQPPPPENDNNDDIPF